MLALGMVNRSSWQRRGGIRVMSNSVRKLSAFAKKRTIGRRFSERFSYKPPSVDNRKSKFPVMAAAEQKSRNGKVPIDDPFHRAIAPILILAQCFGVMPVNNISDKNIANQEFRWTSPRTIYSIFCCTSLAMSALISIAYNIAKAITIESFVSCVFYISNATVIVSFLFLARKWPEIIAKWSDIERQLTPKPNQSRQWKKRVWHDWRLSTKIRLITISILSLCAVEHSLSVKRYFTYAETCPKVTDSTKAIFVQHFTELFYFTSYSLPKALWARFMMTVCVFTWTYMDCFVSILSVVISSGFYKLNSQMRIVKGMNIGEEFWKRQRRNYRSLCEFCEFFDDHISHLTMTSFTNNLIFICVQLQNSMQNRPSMFQSFYFWFSLILLIGRTLAVILFSSQINDQSHGPMEFIRVVPSQSWCLELRRFYDEVASDTIALTGMKFFKLTRGVVLSLTGTIITYELVLIQLRGKHQAETDLCEEIYY